MMLIVATESSPQSIEHMLLDATRPMNLIVSVQQVEASSSPPQEHAVPYVLSVYGADHPGIVYRITAALSAAAVNVTDLATHVVAGSRAGDPPVYVMMMELTIPTEVDAQSLEHELRAIATEQGVDISLRAADPDTF